MKFCFFFFFVVALVSIVAVVSSLVSASSSAYPPVMAVFTNAASWCGPVPDEVKKQQPKTNSCVLSWYVRWLEASGIRVVPLPWNSTWNDQRALLDQVNGILFPGGGLTGSLLDFYVSKVRRILNEVLSRPPNRAPVVWGTCQGFQVVAAALASDAKKTIVGPVQGMYPLMAKLNKTTFTKQSKMFRNLPEDVKHDLFSTASTLNWHHDYVPTSLFTEDPRLWNLFEVGSVNTFPGSNIQFASAFEARGADGVIFASQFHPERPPFEFTIPTPPGTAPANTPEAIRVSQHFSRFLRGRLDRNTNRFGSVEQEQHEIIERKCIRSYGGWGHETFWCVDP